MYYTVDRRAPAVGLAEALQTRQLPQTARIFGLPADTAIRIAAPLVTGMISTVGLIYSIRGKHHAATMVALTGVLLSSFVSVAQVVEAEDARAR